MSPSPPPAQISKKSAEILKAAQQRFGVYGLRKTSMKEIAEDLNISKAALYYYFPDKEHLYKAVVQKEHKEMLKVLKEITKTIDDPATALKEYVDLRLTYFKTVLNLNQLRVEELKKVNPFFGELWYQFQLKEAEIIKQIFLAGVKKKVFYIKDPDETVILFMDILRGLRQQVFTKKGHFFIDENEYKILTQKTNAFMDLFIKALQYKPKK